MHRRMAEHKKVVFTAFAFKEGYQTSKQTGKEASQTMIEIYMENIYVALTSAGIQNPDVDLVAVVNQQPPQHWQRLFQEANIKVKLIPFDTFVLPPSFTWALAFYKLCALKAMLEEGSYNLYLLMDNDTFTTGSYQQLWKDALEAVLLYPVGHSYDHPDRQIICHDWEHLYPEESGNPVHYGGEFVAGNLTQLKAFMVLAEGVFEQMSECKFAIDKATGDESVWSMAAQLAETRRGPIIRGAGAYLYRFWTGDFYLISTVTVANPVCIWHIPNEKENGFSYLYQIYQKKGCYPQQKKVAAILGIAVPKRPFNRYTLWYKCRAKWRKIRNSHL